MKTSILKRALCLFLAALLSGLLITATGETFPYVAHATDSVRLRAKPSSSATILVVIRQGDAVLITGSDGRYKIVEYEGKKGYVVSAFLSADQDAGPVQNTIDPKIAALYQTLSSGSEGAAVKALQEALQELGYYTIAIDSKYGSGTAKAVSAFQDKNGLADSGMADAATQHLLYEGQPKNSRGRVSQVKTLAPIPGLTIRPGKRGDAVAVIQKVLTDLKYYTGKIDGEYGISTQNAVKAFQKDNKLASDGIIGAKTYQALEKAQQTSGGVSATLPPPAPVVPEVTPSTPFEAPDAPATYPYTTTAAASVNMRKRASTSSMRILTIPEGAGLEVLEDSGGYLKVNYKKYTGYVVKEFINIPEQYLDGKVLDINQNARVNYQTLAAGAQGRAVRALQHALAELGFYSGKIDGNFGSGTTAGTKAFQKRNGLRETGVALPELQQLIFEKRVRNSKNKLVFTKTLPPLDGLAMKEGDYGDAVYELNEMLVKTKHFDSNVGYEYTRATTQAVRAFQKDHKIKITGKVDAFTLLAIKTAAGISATTPPQDQPPATQEPLTEDNVIIIRDGTTGMAVSRLQQRLVELKYYTITPDGIYNSDDIAAVKHFQRVNNLPVTGIADLATQQTLYTAYALGADKDVSPQPPQGSTGLLKIGSYGSEVSALQSRLITLNFLTGKIDGIYGTQTAAAVTAFQRANKLKADGLAGSATLTALYDAKAIGNTPTQPTIPPQSAEEDVLITLKVGSRGPEVVNVQKRLIDLKYLTGNADGIYGPRTFLAVKEFQTKNRLTADGLAGSLTIAKLNSTSAIAGDLGGVAPPPIPTPQPQPSGPSFKAPRASEVRYANWFTDIRPIAQRLRDVVIYDFMSGKHYNFRFFSLGKHADGAPLTKADTDTMNSVLGANNWTPRPVWVIFSDGRVFMASTHSHGHQNDYIPDNGITGHLCVHFPREMAEAALTGPYAVSHQNAIQAGWDLTQNMAR